MSAADSKEERAKRRRAKKAKEHQIVISLYINGVAYKYGIKCTFCEKKRAIVHCPECADFYCLPCDTTAHSHAKRKDHIRAKISKLNIDSAARICARAVIFFFHLRNLQRRARELVKRFFDPVTLCHYYLNTVYNTVSWRKPYCLRQEELFPFFTRETAVPIMQGMYRMRKARHRMIAAILDNYERIFDRTRGRFYYAFVGKSKMLPTASWQAPLLMNRRGYRGSIRIVFTDDVAAILIQQKWRAILLRRFLRAIVRMTYEQQWDPVSGTYTYMHIDTEERLTHKPLLMGNERWDPLDVPDWTTDEVVIFIRRMGLKQYAKEFKQYNVDGRTLLLLDIDDYPNVGVTNIIHIKKIIVELDKVYPPWKREAINQLHLIRREKIRRQKELDFACTQIQRVYRGHLGRVDRRNLEEVNRVLAEDAQRKKFMESSSKWWSEQIADNPPQYELPPLKLFGKHRDYYGCEGWGGVRHNKWNKLPALHDFRDVHITQVLVTERLKKCGYDRRRKELREGRVQLDKIGEFLRKDKPETI